MPSTSNTLALLPTPMLSSMRPIAGAMPMRTPYGMAPTIISRMLHKVSTTNTTPSANTIMSAAWNDAT